MTISKIYKADFSKSNAHKLSIERQGSESRLLQLCRSAAKRNDGRDDLGLHNNIRHGRGEMLR